MACDRSLCIPNSVHVVVINARVSSGKRKFRGRDILVFKSNRNRPLCTHHWLLHFAIEISTLRQICKYTKRGKAAGAGKEKRQKTEAKERGGRNNIFKYPIASNIHSQFGKLFMASNAETLLEFKEYAILPERRPKEIASEEEWARSREPVFGGFQGLLNVDYPPWIKA